MRPAWLVLLAAQVSSIPDPTAPGGSRSPRLTPWPASSGYTTSVARIALEDGAPLNSLPTVLVSPEAGCRIHQFFRSGILRQGSLFVQKPFRSSDLAAKVRAALANPRRTD